MKINTKYQILNTKRGFTLIEALLILFIFSLITVTFYSLISVGTHYIQDSRNRLGALAIANEKMETIRNLSYNNIGTVGGEIDGNILQDETVTENTRSYNVHTLIEYIQDPLDGLNPPSDLAFEDYKKVTVTISWGDDPSSQVKLISRFVPPGLEVVNPGDGILAINVFSDQPGGTGIPHTNVRVVNHDTGLDVTKETDDGGNVVFLGDKVTDSIQKYEITVTKSGYESVSTMPPYPATSYNPVDVHASVIGGTLNVTNIVQNQLGNLKVSVVDYMNNPVTNLSCHLAGGRKLGNAVEAPYDPIYNLTDDFSTGSDGEKNFGSVSPGQYWLSFPSLPSQYEIIEDDPVFSFVLLSNDDYTYQVKLADKTQTSLLVKVKNGDGLPIAGAEVHLSNALGYDTTLTTNDEGIVFFPDNADPFADGLYDLVVTADGYSENSSQITINPNELKIENIQLTSS